MKVYRKKKNGRYEELGTEFKGFPADGLWFVWDGRENCIVQLENLKGKSIEDEMPEMIRVNKIIEDALLTQVVLNKTISVADRAREITQKLFIKEK